MDITWEGNLQFSLTSARKAEVERSLPVSLGNGTIDAHGDGSSSCADG